MAKKKLTNADYARLAKSNSKFVPSQKKYRRRKAFNRWEKAAISRASNKIAKASRGRTLQPLTKKQARKIDRAFVIGNGIRAVPVRAAEIVNGNLRVERDGNFTIIREQKGRKRRWHYIHLLPDINEVIIALEDIAKKLRRNEVASVHVLTAAGIEGVGHTIVKDDTGQLIDFLDEVDESINNEEIAPVLLHFINFINKYSSLDPSFEEWFLGLAYFVEKINP